MGWRRLRAACMITLALFLTGCAPAVSRTTATPSVVPPMGTFTPIPTLTPAFTATPQSLPAPTAETAAAPGTYYTVVSAENVNLRTKPGTIFPVSRLLAKGTRLKVVGHAPGGEWLYLLTDSNIYGWVLYWLVSGGHDGGPTPLVEPDGVQMVRGKVLDRAGVPVSGIGFAVTQGSGAGAARTDATTDASGQFYAFVPLSAGGTWLVSYISVSCTSNTMDANCNCIGACGTADPQSIPMTLPANSVLQFVWK